MGRSKAWLPLDGETLLERIIRLVRRFTNRVVVAAAEGQSLPPIPAEVRVVRDDADGQGPIRGMLAGLESAGSPDELLYVTAVDTPFLAEGWAERLASLIGDRDAAIVEVEGRPQPLSAVYRRGPTTQMAREMIAEGDYRLTGLARRLRARTVMPYELADIDVEVRSAWNCNDPIAFALANRWAAMEGFRRVDGVN